MDESFEEDLDFALSEYDADPGSQLLRHFGDIRHALSRARTYYAVFSDPGNIDLFVVDLEGGRVYQINHNT